MYSDVKGLGQLIALTIITDSEIVGGERIACFVSVRVVLKLIKQESNELRRASPISFGRKISDRVLIRFERLTSFRTKTDEPNFNFVQVSIDELRMEKDV